MSSTRQASPARVKIGGQKRTGSIPSCSSGRFSVGCVANGITAAWQRSRRSRRKTPNGRTESARASSASARASRKASAQLERLRTPERTPRTPNTLAELAARLHFVGDQIQEIETTRLARLEQRPEEGKHAMVRLLARGL